jgi:predicted amidohydrolase
VNVARGSGDRAGERTADLLLHPALEHLAGSLLDPPPQLLARELEAADSEEELERLRRIAQTPAESMLGVFRELESRYGSVEGYLRSTGLTEEELERLRHRLRG